jgi:hypothetical protein
MAKKCTICEEEAQYNIKGTSEYYCDDCAKENFSDISLLQKIEEQAKIIKNLIKDKEKNIIEDNSIDDEEMTDKDSVEEYEVQG